MSTQVQQEIEKELHNMSREQILEELAALKTRKAKLKARQMNPAARKAYYEKVKNDPKWQAARKVQAEKRKAKENALLAIAKKYAAEGRLDAETAEVLGI